MDDRTCQSTLEAAREAVVAGRYAATRPSVNAFALTGAAASCPRCACRKMG